MTHFSAKTLSPSEKIHTCIFSWVFLWCRAECRTPSDDANCCFSFPRELKCRQITFRCWIPLPCTAGSWRACFLLPLWRQTGREGWVLPFGQGSCCTSTTVCTSNSLCSRCGFPCKACCSCSRGFPSITSHMWQEAHVWWAERLQGGTVVSAWIFWVLFLPISKLHDCKISALDLSVTSFRAKTKCVIMFGVRCCLTEEK